MFNLNPSKDLVWATLLGTPNSRLISISADANDKNYILGVAVDSFPTIDLVSAQYNDSTFNGGTRDYVICGFSSSDQLIWSTFFGGSGAEEPNSCSIYCDTINGQVYIGGSTTSTDYPLQNHALAFYDSTNSLTVSGGVISKFVQEDLRWSTYFDNNVSTASTNEVRGFCADTMGNTWVIGRAGRVPILTPTGYYTDNAVVGSTEGFIARFTSVVDTLNYSTYYGGGAGEVPTAIKIVGDSVVYMVGYTNTISTNSFPYVRSPYAFSFNDSTLNGTSSNVTTQNDGFIAKICLNQPPPVGFAENNLPLENVSIFPNPTSGIINYSLSSQNEKRIYFRLYDVSGRLISEKNILLQKGDNKGNFDISPQNNGIYFLQINSENRSYTCKIIKNG